MRRTETRFTTPSAHGLAGRLGAAIKAARLARNWRQADFAERARISLATAKRIEAGDVAVGLSSWLSAFEVLGLLRLLEPAGQLDSDRLGTSLRHRQARQRARGGAADAYDF